MTKLIVIWYYFDKLDIICTSDILTELILKLLSQVFHLMKFDSYNRFLKSELYLECVQCENQDKLLPFEDEVEEDNRRKVNWLNFLILNYQVTAIFLQMFFNSDGSWYCYWSCTLLFSNVWALLTFIISGIMILGLQKASCWFFQSCILFNLSFQYYVGLRD